VFINVAFAAARQAGSNAKLYINEYNLGSANPKVTGFVELVNTINSVASSRLIDGCGTSSHRSARQLHLDHLAAL